MHHALRAGSPSMPHPINRLHREGLVEAADRNEKVRTQVVGIDEVRIQLDGPLEFPLCARPSLWSSTALWSFLPDCAAPTRRTPQ